MDFAGQLRPQVRLEPDAVINPHATEAIRRADIIVIAPGNLYASLAPALVVGGVSQALQSSHAKLVYICNLVTKPGQTDGFQVEDYAAEIERFWTGLDWTTSCTTTAPANGCWRVMPTKGNFP